MSQSLEEKYFGGATSGLDADSADFVVGPNDWVNAENIRTNSTDAGVVGSIEAIGSAILRSPIVPSVTFLTIGSAEDTANNRILRLQYSLYGPWHQIVCYDVAQKTEYLVLRNDQTEENAGIIFDKNYPIHSARVINGILYWTDYNEQPKKINIDAGIKLNHPSYNTTQSPYTVPVDYTVLTIIRQPPTYPIQAEKDEDVDFENNFIANESFQFYYRYFFRDYEYSVLSTNGTLVPYNYTDETFNYIQVSIPAAEFIEQDVQRVEVIVQYGNGGDMFIVKSWDKSIPSEAAEIADHNAAIGQLQFDFYNNITGTPVDQNTATKPFDRVPLISKTLETAQNRLFLGNNKLGYTTPSPGSLTLSIQEVEEGADLIAYFDYQQLEIYEDGIKEDPQIRNVYIVTVPGADPQYYYFHTIVPPDIPPDPIDLGTATFSSNSLFQLYKLIAGDPSYPVLPGGGTGTSYTSSVSGGAAGISTGSRVFKSNGTYRVAIVFYDRYRRKCGVVVPANNEVVTPDRTYNQTVYNFGINWLLSNANALNEIPDWAYYYQIVRTKNLTASSFVQARAKNMTYVTKANDGVLSFSTSAYANSNYAVGVDISALPGFGIGYVYAEGDVIDLFFDGSANKVELAIIGQDGKWLICELQDLGTLDSSSDVLFEIYTPYRQQINEFYYEVGALYDIINPTTSSRIYSQLSGTLNGDVYLLTRDPDTMTAYLVEAMSPNDKYWQNWYSDIGWGNIVDRIGQVVLKNSILFSNTYVEGTRTNGLSSFDALSQKDVPLECGQLQKLQLTSKINNEKGAIMLAICQMQAASLYMGEVQLYGSAQEADVVQAPQVIGTINVLKGNFGTNNPESVIEFRGNVFWVDVMNGKVIQYSTNGLFPISNYKMTRYWKLFSDQYMSMTAQEIENLGSRPFIFSAVDPHHWELLITVPKLLETPPKGYLPDYPETIYPFDIWDGQAKTLVFKLNVEPNHWQGAYTFVPEGMISMQNKLFCFKYGHLYEMNSSESFCEFFGVQYRPKIMILSNEAKAIPKVYDNISINGTKPSFVYMRSEIPYEQSSDLENISFQNLEGNYYAVVLRNKLVPTANGFTTNGLMTAEKMRAIVLKILIQWDVSDQNINFNFISIGFHVSTGHKNFKPK